MTDEYKIAFVDPKYLHSIQKPGTIPILYTPCSMVQNVEPVKSTNSTNSTKSTQVTKLPATLLSCDKVLDEDICTIRWTGRWGFIIADYKGHVKVYGSGPTDLQIQLDFTGQSSFPINWDIATTEPEQDIVIIRPSLDKHKMKQINVFSVDAIHRIASKDGKYVDMKDPVDSVIVHYDEHLTIQGSDEKLLDMSDFLNQRFTFSNDQELYDTKCVCFVKFPDYHYQVMMIGHLMGYISVWKIPLSDIDLADTEHHVIRVRKGYDCVREDEEYERIRSRHRRIHGSLDHFLL